MSDPVSRETPPAPDVASGVFSHRLPMAESLAELLAGDAVVRGLIGPREVPRLWERHLLNCALLADAFGEGATVCDIGSGAGLPGLVLAVRRPDLELTLVEPLLRRTVFLDEAVAALGLTNVEVVRARAEELHGRRQFDVVTARAVAPLERLAGWTLPLVRQGGELVAMKGASAADEVERAKHGLHRLGGADVRVEQFGVDLLDPPTTAVRVRVDRPPRLGWDRPSSGGRGKPRGKRPRRRKER